MQNKKMCILILLTATFFMIIAVFYIKQTQNKISKIEYIVDNSNLGSNIAIMVLDLETKEYLKAKEIPVGKYILNGEKTHCVGRGIVNDYDNKNGTIKFETEAADECYIYFDAYSGAYDEIIKKYTGQGMTVGNGVLYLHDSSLANSAADGSYRYAGADPDNYLCFEGDACDDNHKYRIIGIFGDNIKVSKMTSVGNKVWNSSNVNTWSGSTMDTYLNGEWLTNEFDHGDLIEDYDWHVGGYNTNQVYPKVMHDAEITSSPVIKRKVGLMYVSDYGYGAENTYWTTAVNSYKTASSGNWLYYLKTNEWTISHNSSISNHVFAVGDTGYVGSSYAYNNYATRPVFYLKPSVEIKSGSGSKTDPWIMG